ncbi:MAG: hypothetical protein M5U19_02245 [Microthrixaceae bacterium]|nr:hypothetical protein [Microthrixaceae bacterium]
MQVHLVDGTYELFRNFYAPRGGHTNGVGEEVGAVRGVLRGTVSMLAEGVSHIGVATDHVIESFRNDLWPGYKDGSGIEADLRAQFPWLEDALRALGVTVWAMVDHEADDALAAAAAVADADERVERVVIATPDKDLAQCVKGQRVVQYDRRAGEFRGPPRCSTSTASLPNRSRTGLHWSATRPTASPAYPDGGKERCGGAAPLRAHRADPAITRAVGRTGAARCIEARCDAHRAARGRDALPHPRAVGVRHRRRRRGRLALDGADSGPGLLV